MLYRRPPARYRRIPYPSGQTTAANIADSETFNKVENIPLPNEAEENVSKVPEVDETRGIPPIKIFGKTLHIDDIILFGLIFLLIQERIDDELLLILLVYIFLF